MKGYCRYGFAITEGNKMTYLLWIVGGLLAWGIVGFIWCRWFTDDDDDEYQECPYE
jgi:hypothetical protein